MSGPHLTHLLEEYVSQGEPPPPAPTPVVHRGHALRRRRRLAGAGAVMALVALVGGLGWSARDLAGPATPDRSAGTDPATSRAVDEYDASRMPSLMEQRTRPVLERVADPGPASFTAYDSQLIDLPARHWDEASRLVLAYTGGDRTWDVSIAHSSSEAEGDAERFCRDSLADGEHGDLECTVDRVDGAVVITTVTALEPFGFDGAGAGASRIVGRDRLGAADLDRLRYERAVEVVRSETLIVSASESVTASTADPDDVVFLTPVEDLVEIVLDPALTMPPPPCPGWNLAQGDGACETP